MTENIFRTLEIASDFEQIDRLETFLNEFRADANISSDLFANIQLAANEAVTNAIVHGNELIESKKVQIRAQKRNGEIEITVKDEGKGFDPDALPDPTSEEQLLKESGRGVFLIKQYADDVSFEQEGRLVAMKFYTD